MNTRISPIPHTTALNGGGRNAVSTVQSLSSEIPGIQKPNKNSMPIARFCNVKKTRKGTNLSSLSFQMNRWRKVFIRSSYSTNPKNSNY
jgi:hypothetical protein